MVKYGPSKDDPDLRSAWISVLGLYIELYYGSLLRNSG